MSREAEIDKFHVSVPIDHHVLQLHVSVGDSATVQKVDSLDELTEQRDGQRLLLEFASSEYEIQKSAPVVVIGDNDDLSWSRFGDGEAAGEVRMTDFHGDVEFSRQELLGDIRRNCFAIDDFDNHVTTVKL